MPGVDHTHEHKPDDKGIWTWCPCTTDEELELTYASKQCPLRGVGQSPSSGRWIFRGGCTVLGPPCEYGLFYGETRMVGYCDTLLHHSWSRSKCSTPFESKGLPGGGEDCPGPDAADFDVGGAADDLEEATKIIVNKFENILERIFE